MKEMCSLVMQRAKTLSGRFNIIFQLSLNYYKQKKVGRVIHRHTDDLIKSRRKEIERGGYSNVEITFDELGRKKKLAFLDLLLITKLNGQPLSDKSIKDEVNTFLFAVSPIMSCERFLFVFKINLIDKLLFYRDMTQQHLQ